MILLAVVSGLVLHQIYKRYEPSMYTFGVVLLCAQAGLLSWFHHHGLAPLAAVRDIAILTTIHLSVLVTSILVYRAFLHPLRAFPGPPLAKLSKLWGVPTSTGGDMHLVLQQLHQKYGDFVRIGPNELSISNADATIPIYGPNGWIKGPAYDCRTGLAPGEPDMEALRSHAEHARRRKTWSAGFTTKALVEYQEQLRERTGQFMETLEDSLGTPVDMRTLFRFLITDLLFDLAFGGRGPQLLKAGKDTTGMFEALGSFVQAVVAFSHVPSLTPITKLLPTDPKVAAFVQLCEDCYTARAEDPSPSQDIFRHLIADLSPVRNTEKDRQLLREAKADTVLLIIAGSDTTGSVLANLLFFLLTEPGLKSFRELQSEVDRAHRDKDDLDWNQIAQEVPFLDCCINETMRLLPPTPAGPLQRTAPRGGGVVCDNFIPAGTHVSIPLYGLHRDPRYFSNPDKFVPQRWMSGQKEKIQQTAFMPFSYGPYGCIGKQLAFQEMRLVMTAILRQYDARLPDNFDAEKYAKSNKAFFVLQIMEPLPVIFTKRELKAQS